MFMPRVFSYVRPRAPLVLYIRKLMPDDTATSPPAVLARPDRPEADSHGTVNFAFSREHADWALLRKGGRLKGW